MFAIVAAILLFIMAILNVAVTEMEANISSALFLLALGFWALHFGVPIPLVRRRHPPQ